MTKKVIKGAELEKKSSLAQKVRKAPSKGKPKRVVAEIGGVVSGKVLDAQGRAEKIIAEAQAEAERIRAEAQQLLEEVEAVRAEAKVSGYEEGREEGLASITELATQLTQLKEQFYTEAEPEILKLVMQIAEKVIARLVDEHSDTIKAVVRQAIEASIGDRLTVRVHPEDYQTVMAAESEFREVIDRTKRLHFKEDEAITRGGCVVETEIGTIDAQLETQLKAIRKALEL